MQATVNDPHNAYNGKKVTLRDSGVDGVYIADHHTEHGVTVSFVIGKDDLLEVTK